MVASSFTRVPVFARSRGFRGWRSPAVLFALTLPRHHRFASDVGGDASSHPFGTRYYATLEGRSCHEPGWSGQALQEQIEEEEAEARRNAMDLRIQEVKQSMRRIVPKKYVGCSGFMGENAYVYDTREWFSNLKTRLEPVTLESLGDRVDHCTKA